MFNEKYLKTFNLDPTQPTIPSDSRYLQLRDKPDDDFNYYYYYDDAPLQLDPSVIIPSLTGQKTALVDNFYYFDGSIWAAPCEGCFYSQGSLVVQGSSQLMRSLLPIASVSRILGSISKASGCDDHMLVLSESPSVETVRWGPVKGRVSFGWNCASKVIIGQAQSASHHCAAIRKYSFEVDFVEPLLVFRDDVCGVISLSDTFRSFEHDNYIYIGADDDTGGAAWNKLRVLSAGGAAEVPTNGPSSRPVFRPSLWPTQQPSTHPGVELFAKPTAAPASPSFFISNTPAPNPSLAPSKALLVQSTLRPSQELSAGLPLPRPSSEPSQRPWATTTFLPTWDNANDLSPKTTHLPTPLPSHATRNNLKAAASLRTEYFNRRRMSTSTPIFFLAMVLVAEFWRRTCFTATHNHPEGAGFQQCAGEDGGGGTPKWHAPPFEALPHRQAASAPGPALLHSSVNILPIGGNIEERELLSFSKAAELK